MKIRWEGCEWWNYLLAGIAVKEAGSAMGSRRLGSGYSFWMRVRVLYFGVLKDLMRCGGTEMVLREGLSVAELLEVHRGSAAASVWDSIAVAVNQQYARGEDVLKDGDEVALLPPVSGGSEELA
jgi:molybdopterin converting factor small subunit